MAEQPDFTPIPVDPAPNAEVLNPQTFGSGGGSAKGLKYNVNSYTYPETVGGSKDLQHYMVFFINIRGKSKYVNSYKSLTPISTDNQNNLGSRGATAGTKALGIAGGAALGTGLSSLITKNLNSTAVTNKVLKVISIGGGAYLGSKVADALNGKLNLFQPDKSFRIDQAIMLAVNEKPSVKYSVQYDGKDLGNFLGYLAGSSSASDAIKNERNSELARTIALNIANIPAGIANLIGANLDIGSAIQVGMAAAPNPFREQVFHNVDTRVFQFDYKFLPRSATEAAHVNNIIKQFKFHMHPEISTGGLFYIYPSTFDIAYYYKGNQNPYLHKVSTCVLENMNVDYGGAGFNTFADGMPTEVNIRLQFRELEVLTKERIEKGY